MLYKLANTEKRIIKKISNWTIIIGFIIVALIIWNRVFRYREAYTFDNIHITHIHYMCNDSIL
jgi:hypothetical protein